ncbi:hypothetical protein D3C87_441590 [compost metagenome]
MNQQPVIRTYQPSDKTACMNAFQTNVPKFFTYGEVGDFERFLDRLADPAELNQTPYYVLELNNELIGCGGFMEKEGIDGKSAVTFTWGLVHRDFHKQGYGEELLQFRIKEIKTRFPAKQVILDTTQFSYTFFEKYGFKTVKFTENGYEEGMHRYDMVLDGSSSEKFKTKNLNI